MNSTPENIDEMSRKEVLSLVRLDQTHENVRLEPVKMRAKLLKVLYEMFGYDLTNDALLALISEPSAELILATAGAGKTTAVQSKIVLEKLVRSVNGKPLKGHRVLCIVYNKHNVKQMVKAQEKLARKVQARGLPVDGEITASTMHSFCYKWFNHFNHLTKFIGGNMLEPPNVVRQFEALCNVLLRDSGAEINSSTVDDLINLYNLLKETMTPYEECDTVELFETIKLPKELIVKLFNAYDKGKQRKNQYDYTDMLQELYDLLKHNETARTYIQEHYDYIVADEVQDMTGIMMEILRLSKRKDVPLLCIGDEDQNIYSFRGATIKTILKFEEMFDDAKIFTLATNRRCGKNIIDLAEKIISRNTLRYEKSMRAVREGGDIEFVPYCKHVDQIEDVCNKLKVMSSDQLNQTCICYRNRRSSMLLSCRLEELGIPFHVMSGYPPFAAEVFQHILSIFRILLYPYDRDEIINIYKVLPIVTKGEVYETLGYSPKTKNFSKPYEKIHFSEYNYSKNMDNQKVIDAMYFLAYVSNNINKMKMNEFMETLMILFNDSFWKSKMYYNKTQEEDNMFTKYAMEFFNLDMTLPKFYEAFSARMERCKVNDYQKNGVCLSTFHSLKGLEFKNVFIIDLDDRIFPNFSKIDENDYSDSLKIELKESETRLFFVAITRAKDRLVFYYDKENPSEYIKWIQDDMEGHELDLKSEEPEMFMTNNVTAMDLFNDDTKKILDEVPEEEDDDLFEVSANPDSNSANPDLNALSEYQAFEEEDDDLFADIEVSAKPDIDEVKPEPQEVKKDFSASFLDTVMDRFF